MKFELTYLRHVKTVGKNMDSGTISHTRNILINKSFAKQKERQKTKFFAQNSLVKISSSPKIRKSPRVKISREEDFLVAQFATYRPIWQH